MTPNELEQAGKALFGEQWKTPLADALGVARKTVQRWANGEWPIKPSAADDIRRLLGAKRAEQALAEVDRLAAEEGRPPEIALTEGRDEVGRRATELVAEALRARGVTVTIVPVQGDLTDPARRATAAAIEAARRRRRRPARR